MAHIICDVCSTVWAVNLRRCPNHCVPEGTSPEDDITTLRLFGTQDSDRDHPAARAGPAAVKRAPKVVEYARPKVRAAREDWATWAEGVGYPLPLIEAASKADLQALPADPADYEPPSSDDEQPQLPVESVVS